ncbi:DNA gyrase B [Babesia caballi]|uniref:DNA gyrase B n=1 Tax=Babesia caballi TaxID=5871 RepID=A0AAV4LRR8_BABCB|nr:DNA gyrase B [Babesia caballi]
MVDGVYPDEHGDDQYIVHSQSESCRKVDMLFFTCNCPSTKALCSHLIATALANNREHDYLGKLVIMKEVEKRIRDIVGGYLDVPLDVSVTRHISKCFLQLAPTERTVRMLLEVLIGVCYRLLQLEETRRLIDCLDKERFEILGLVKPTSTLKQVKSTYDELEESSEKELRDMVKSFQIIGADTDLNYVDYSKYLVDTYYDHDDPYYRVNDDVYNDEEDLHLAILRMYHRFTYLIQSIGRLLKPAGGSSLRDAVESLIPVAQRVLEDEYGIVWTSRIEDLHLEETLKLLMKCYKYENEHSPVVDGYALGFDYAEKRARRSEANRDLSNAAETLQKIKDQIIAAPMMSDIYRVTHWAAMYQPHFGTLRHVLKAPSMDLSGQMILITLHNDCVIKVPSTQGFEDPYDILKVMTCAVHEDNARSFTAHGLTLLVLVKKIALLPSRSQLKKAIDAMLPSDATAGFGCRFVAECVHLLPDPLVLPFFKAYFYNTEALKTPKLAMIAARMCVSIAEGHMSDAVHDRMLRIGAFFGLPVSEEWEKAEKVAKRYLAKQRQARMAPEGGSCELAAKVEEAPTAAADLLQAPVESKLPSDTPASITTAADSSSSSPQLTVTTSSEIVDGEKAPPAPAAKDSLAPNNATGDAQSEVGKNEAAEKSASPNEQTSQANPATDLVPQPVNPPNAATKAAREEPQIELIATPAGDKSPTAPKRATGKAQPLLPAEVEKLLWAPMDSSSLGPGKTLIHQIRNDEFGLELNKDKLIHQMSGCVRGKTLKVLANQRKRIARSIKRLSEDLYNTRIHLQLELLQNADDNEYDVECPEIAFLLASEGVVVINNERGFREQDVRSLCDIGKTTKVGGSERKIGKFGIGFKSVFLVTDSPHVFSNGYHFMFSCDPKLENNTEYIMPHWVNVEKWGNPFAFVRDSLSLAGATAFAKMLTEFTQRHGAVPNTLMFLPFKQSMTAGISTFCADFQKVGQMHLAFLRKLTAITFVNASTGSITSLRRSVALDEAFTVRLGVGSNLESVEVGKSAKGIQPTTTSARCEQVILTKEERTLDGKELSADELRLFLLTHLGDPGNTQTGFNNAHGDGEVTVGLPLRPKGAPYATYDVHNMLPIADYGLPFLVNADFALSASRQSIIGHDPRNALLASGVADAFVTLACLICLKFRHVPDAYHSLLGAIPDEGSGRDCFADCCRTIRQKLQRWPWVAVRGPGHRCALPSQALVLPSTAFLPMKRDHVEVLRAVFPDELLMNYCDVKYASPEVQDPQVRDTVVGVGVNELDPSFITTLLKNLLKSIDVSVPISAQPQIIQTFYRANIGVVLCILERLAGPRDLDDVRSVLLLPDAQGMLMGIGECTYFVRSDSHLSASQLPKLVSPSLFENPWEIEGYANRVAAILELMGCTEVTPGNLLTSLVAPKLRSLLDGKDTCGNEEIVTQGRDILHTLARNHDKLDTLGAEEVESIRSMPLVTHDGKVATLGDEFVRFCPSNDAMSKIAFVAMDVKMHYSTVRKFASDVGLQYRYLSDDYLAGVGIQSGPASPQVGFQNLVAVFNHFGVYTFLRFCPFDSQVDTRGHYELPSLPVACDQAVEHCRKERNVDLTRLSLFGCDKVVHDWYSPDFCGIADLVRRLYAAAPGSLGRTTQNQSATTGQIQDGPKQTCQQQAHNAHAHNLSITLYRLVNHELTLYPQSCWATLETQERTQQLGRSLLYHQLRNVRWLPYKAHSHSGSEEGAKPIWQPAPPVAAEDDVGYHSIFFFQRDEVVENEILIQKRDPDFLELLNFICEEFRVRSASSDAYGAALPEQPQATPDAAARPSEAERLLRGFSRGSFVDALRKNPAAVRTAVGALYRDLYRQMQQDSALAARVRVEFSHRKLVVVFGALVGDCFYEWEPQTLTSRDPLLAVYKSIVGCSYLVTLAEEYAEFPELEAFWLHLGVGEYVCPQQTLQVLDRLPKQGAGVSLEAHFECVLHLYNTMDQEAFVEALWDRACIPVTAEAGDMFQYDSAPPSENPAGAGDIIAPHGGIVRVQTQESKDLVAYLCPVRHKGIWIARRPQVRPLGKPESRYSDRYLRNGEASVNEAWARILALLKATELRDHCSLEPAVMPAAVQAKWPMGTYAMLILLPYVHYYIRSRMRSKYAQCCERLPRLLARVDVLATTCVLTVLYRYRKDGVTASGKLITPESFVHCDDNGTLQICVSVKEMPVNVECSGDIITRAQQAVGRGHLRELPQEFFVNLAKLLLADPDATPVELNRGFMAFTEHERFLAGYLSTVYEMARLQPKSVVDVFVRSYNSGPSARCICTPKPPVLQQPLFGGLEADKAASSASTWSGLDVKVSADEAHAAKDEEGASSMSIGAASFTKYDLPPLEGPGSHLVSGNTCQDNVMDPLVYMFVKSIRHHDSHTATSTANCEPRPETPAEQGGSCDTKSSIPSSPSVAKSAVMNTDDRVISGDTAVGRPVATVPTQGAAEQGLGVVSHFDSSKAPSDHGNDLSGDPCNSKQNNDTAWQSHLDRCKAKATTTPNLELVPKTIHDIKKPAQGPLQGDATYSDVSKIHLFYGKTMCYKDVTRPLACMLVLDDDLKEVVTSVSVLEFIEAERFANPAKMKQKLGALKPGGAHADSLRNGAVGYLGEEFVYELLQEMLKPELASDRLRLLWYNKDNESGLAYDLSIRSDSGEEVFIEVKSSASATKSHFEVSHKEWLFAQQMGARYEIFRVSGVGHDTVDVKRLVNPYCMWKSGHSDTMGTIKGDQFRFETISILKEGSKPPQYTAFRVPVPLETPLVLPEEGEASEFEPVAAASSSLKPMAVQQNAATIRAPFWHLVNQHIPPLEKQWNVRMGLKQREGAFTLMASGEKASEAIVEMLNLCRTSRVYNYYLCFPVRGEQFHSVFGDLKQKVAKCLGASVSFEERPHVTLALLNLVTDEDVDAVVRALQATTLAISQLSLDSEGHRKPYSIELAGVKSIKYKGQAARRSVFFTHAQPEDTLSDIASEYQSSVKRAVNQIISASRSHIAKAKLATEGTSIARMTEAEAAARGVFITPGGNVEVSYTDIAVVDPKGAVSDAVLNDMLAQQRAKYSDLDDQQAQRSRGSGGHRGAAGRKGRASQASTTDAHTIAAPPRGAADVDEDSVTRTDGAPDSEGSGDTLPEYETSVTHELHITLLRSPKVDQLNHLTFHGRGSVCCVELRPRGAETCAFNAYTKTHLVRFVGNRYDCKPTDEHGVNYITGSTTPDLPPDLFTDPGAPEEDGRLERDASDRCERRPLRLPYSGVLPEDRLFVVDVRFVPLERRGPLGVLQHVLRRGPAETHELREAEEPVQTGCQELARDRVPRVTGADLHRFGGVLEPRLDHVVANDLGDDGGRADHGELGVGFVGNLRRRFTYKYVHISDTN